MSSLSPRDPMSMSTSTEETILLIQDDPVDAQRLLDALARQPEEAPDVVHVARLDEARPHLERGSIALLVLDLRLPGSRGLETLARLRMHDPRTIAELHRSVTPARGS